LSTACSFPRVIGKKEALFPFGPSKSEGSIFLGVILFNRKSLRNSLKVITASTSVDSAFLAIQGPIKTVLISSPYIFLATRMVATIGETMLANESTSSGQ